MFRSRRCRRSIKNIRFQMRANIRLKFPLRWLFFRTQAGRYDTYRSQLTQLAFNLILPLHECLDNTFPI